VRIEIRPLSEIFPFEKNARKIPQRAIDKVAASLEEYGWQQPIVVDKHGVIVVGHVRRLGALQLGWTEAPVHVADNLTPAQIRAYRLMDNRSHQEADWDLDLLAPEIAELSALSFDLSLTGFNVHELDVLLRNPLDEEKADQAPPLPDIPVTRLHDLWTCGEHRVLCGDATSAADVARLLGDSKPRLMVTDPPYGISLDSEWRDRAGLNSCGAAEPSYMKKRSAGHTETSISGHEGRLVRSLRTRAEPRGRLRIPCERVYARGARRAFANRVSLPATDHMGQGPNGAHPHSLLVSA
jgi:ParB-like chromosome segregation protein Spo0J